jgi:tRNA A-37 threonylcarbamoyl transferase component Bud32
MLDVGPGDVISERYEVESELGRGGMATVYQVRHLELKSRHALKLLDISSSSVRKRLLQEGRIQASLAHPHIVSVTDVLDVQGSPGLVMEFVDGPSLADLLERRRPTLEEAEHWFRSILEAVGYAHARGLVHRDLKPDNVLMAQLGPTLHPKVADFGIAKVLGDLSDPDKPGTRGGLAMGTPAYMPPEQVNSAADADQRADIFALGCILYELTTGQRAFPSENVLSVFTAVLKGDYIPPRDLEPSLDDRIVSAIERALDPDRSTRTQTVAEFQAILDARVAPTRPAVRPPAPQKTGSVRPVLAMAFSMLVIAALAGVVSLLIGVTSGAIAQRMLEDGRPVHAQPSVPVDHGGRTVPVPAAVEQPPPVPRVDAPPRGTLDIEVSGWRQAEQTQKGVMRYETTEGRLLIADVTVHNPLDEAVDLGFPWALVAPDGTEYGAPLKCHMSLPRSLNPQAHAIEAGERLHGPLCFDGPVDVTGHAIVFRGDGADIRFPL